MANPAPHDRPLTLEEYLDLDDASAVRYEYVGGEAHAMFGATKTHARITGNLFAHLWAAARGGPCRVYQGSVRLRVGDVVYYPDVMVRCGPETAEGRVEEDPCLLVEVLSPSTERIDRREKLMVYRTIPSLAAYLLVDQERRLVERHWRDETGEWRRGTLTEQGTVPLPCPPLALTLDEVYEGVRLPLTPEERRLLRETEGAYVA